MMTVGHELAPTPRAVTEPAGKVALAGEFDPAVPALKGGVVVLGLNATVGVVVGLQGWLGNPTTLPEGFVAPIVFPGFGVVVVVWLGNCGGLWLGVEPAGVAVGVAAGELVCIALCQPAEAGAARFMKTTGPDALSVADTRA